MLWRLLLLLEPGHLCPFLADLCDVARFEALELLGANRPSGG